MMHKRFILVFLYLLISIPSWSQKMKEARWWLGIKGGLTYASPKVIERYSVFQSTGEAEYPKKYGKPGQNKGYTFAASLGLAFSPSLFLILEPAINSYRYNYNSGFSWSDSVTTYRINTAHTQKVNTLEIPLTIQYRLQTGDVFSFYAEAGGMLSLRTGAKKDVILEEVQVKDGKEFKLQEFNETFNQKTLYQGSTWGIVTGAGVSADINYFRLSLGMQYVFGLNNLIREEYRYSDMRLSTSIYDVQDDLRLNALKVFLSVSTPLDYLIHAPGFLINSKKRK